MRPLVPEDLRRNGRNADLQSLFRACVAAGRGAYDRACPGPDQVARAWPRDRDAAALLVTRAAVSPASTSSMPALLATLVRDFIAALGPVSAGAQLFEQGLELTFGSHAAIAIPDFVADATQVSFVGESQPIPVRQFDTGGPMLSAHKLAAICVLTAEMLNGSNAEAMVRDVLTRSAALALDAALFDSNAATDTRPAGLRNGVPASTASAATDPTEAMLADIETLAGSVSVVAGNTPIALVAAPARAMAIRLRAPRELPAQILASSAVTAADLIAVAPVALASATGAVEIESAREVAALHMESAPLPIGDSGILASPTRSLWQTDSIGLKLRFGANWALRHPSALGWLTATNW
jgi:hypothetical protein